MIQKHKFIFFFRQLNIRLFYVILSYIITVTCCYIYSDALIYIFIKPFLIEMYNNRFIFTSLLEIFLTYIKFSLIISIFLIFPIFLLQLWLFFSPGMYQYERKKVLIILSSVLFCFYTSIFIGYYLILPTIWNFFLNFDNNNLLFPLHFEAKINDYLFFMLFILINLIICFQIPSILLILTFFNLVSEKLLIKNKRIFYVIFLLLGTLLSSPDIFSQLLIVICFILLYEIGIFLIYLLKKLEIR